MTYGKYTARDYQQEAHAASINHCKTSNDPAYLYMSVSAGKSFQMSILAQHVAKRGGKVLILAHIGELVEQDADACWEIGQPASMFSASLSVKDTQYPIIVGSEKTVYNALQAELSDHTFDLIQIDEAHRVPFDNDDSVYMKIISELRKRNPSVKILGYTGSPWRGVSSMRGEFWKKELVRIDRPYLTEKEFVMPVNFGFGQETYDRTKFDALEEGDQDFTSTELSAIEQSILEQPTKTQQIMQEVVSAMQSRNVALITCAGRKHCEEAAKALPEGSYAIITEKTPTKERRLIKQKCNKGLLKYVLQIGCWSIGVSIPRLDTIVILRDIRSLTLLEQLIGRGIRLLKDADIELGIIKKDCLVMDYSSTMEVMASMFNSPELEEAELERAKRKGEVMLCPVCDAENSIYARRCINHDHWWKFNECEHCGTKNDVSTKVCSCCGEYMKDPNDNLGKVYSKTELIPVTKMTTKFERNTLTISYHLVNGDIATEMFWPLSDKRHCKNMVKAMVMVQMSGWHDRNMLMKAKTIQQVNEAVKALKTPKAITHRINGKGKSVINLKEF